MTLAVESFWGSTTPLWQLVLLALISMGVGYLGGFVGLALGTMRLPVLLLLGFPAPVAAGTNIIVSTVSAATGLYRHAREGRVEWSIVGLMGIPSLIGAFLGSFLSGRVPEAALIAIASVFVLWQGLELFARGRRLAHASSPAALAGETPQLTTSLAITEAGIGFGIGLLGGAVGLILGSIRLPALLQVLRLDPRIAAGTNLVIGFLTGLFGFAGHGLQGQMDVPVLLVMSLTGLVGTYYGAQLTGRVRPHVLLMVMGAVLTVVGALLLLDAYLRWS